MRQVIHDSPYGDHPDNYHLVRSGPQIELTLTYPPYDDNAEGQIRYVIVGQESVRASDNIRMFYDFERDGWAIQQASRFAWLTTDQVCDPDWQEVAFVQSWGREESDEERDARLDLQESAERERSS